MIKQIGNFLTMMGFLLLLSGCTNSRDADNKKRETERQASIAKGKRESQAFGLRYAAKANWETELYEQGTEFTLSPLYSTDLQSAFGKSGTIVISGEISDIRKTVKGYQLVITSEFSDPEIQWALDMSSTIADKVLALDRNTTSSHRFAVKVNNVRKFSLKYDSEVEGEVDGDRVYLQPSFKDVFFAEGSLLGFE